MLFAFLLTVPFSTGFDRLTGTERRVYYAAIICTAIASMLLIAPPAHHRLRFRGGVKEQLLRIATLLCVVGLVFLAASMGAVVYLITSVVYSHGYAAAITALFVAALAFVWFAMPLAYRPEERTPAGDGHGGD